MIKPKIILIAHDVRSTHNVGSFLRTADGLGISKVYLTGYTPYPDAPDDERLPHVRLRASKQISKTALGAEQSVDWRHVDDIFGLIGELRGDGFAVAALEQTANSKPLPDFKNNQDLALIVGSEVEGLPQNISKAVDFSLEIPMLGQKESFNVAVAAAIALYHLSYG